MPKKTRVLIAPDKFKGSLTARQVAEAIASGLSTGRDNATVECVLLPLADGGDGSVDAALAAGFQQHRFPVAGPIGQPTRATVAFDGTTAVVEVANSCGLALLPPGELHPLDASSRGFGEAILHALTLKPRRVVLALGGSASTDGGMGMLSTLGYTFRNAKGMELHGSGRALHEIESVDVSPVPALAETELVLATDVHNPLLGSAGAAAVFGPQKGATPKDIRVLEEGLLQLVRKLEEAGSDEVSERAARPGAGSAGGIGFACTLLGARQVSGAGYFLDLLDFDRHKLNCDLIITGEGSIDEQTLDGKLLSEVAKRSRALPVVAVAGRSLLHRSRWSELSLTRIHALTEYTDRDSSGDPQLSINLLRTIGADIGAGLADPIAVI